MDKNLRDYERIASAIRFLRAHVQEQPSLEALAAHLHLSPFHLQRLFSQWAGTTPKRFLQVLTLELGKTLLQQSSSVLEASEALGLSSASRLYDHFITLEGVSPGEFRSRGQGLNISYALHDTAFGQLFIANTERGICKAAFTQSSDFSGELSALQQQWPKAVITPSLQDTHFAAALITQLLDPENTDQPPSSLPLYVQGTNFQLAVWQALLKIPPGSASTYSRIAKACGRDKAARAVGNAIGANPVAILIPCHRVIQESGALGGYRWGLERKVALQIAEQLCLERT